MTSPTISDNSIARFLPLVELDGERDPVLIDLVVGMRMEEHVGGRSTCELELRASEFDDQAGVHAPFNELKPGQQLTISVGDQVAPTEIFSGVVSAVEFVYQMPAAPLVRLYAEDGLDGSRHIAHTRSWQQTSLRDIVDEVGGESLRVMFDSAAQLDLAPSQVVQLDESDLAFLRRILTQIGHDMQVVGDELHVAPVAAGGRGNFDVEYGVHLLSANVVADLADQVTSVSAQAYDHESGKQPSTETVDSADLGQAPDGGRDGASFLSDIGDRDLPLSWPLHRDPDRARGLAEVEFMRRAQRFVTLEGEMTGSPDLRCGCVINVNGLGPHLDQSYHLERVVHVSDSDVGYRCFITAHAAWLGGT